MVRPSKGITDGVVVRATIPVELDAVINSLVSMSGGVSKSTFIRQALIAGLQPYGLVSLEIAALAVTKQSGTPHNRERK